MKGCVYLYWLFYLGMALYIAYAIIATIVISKKDKLKKESLLATIGYTLYIVASVIVVLSAILTKN